MRSACLCLLLLAPLAHAGPAPDGFVAGLTPDRRPEGAPRITTYSGPASDPAQALKGVDTPYPASLRFVRDHGGWFTPLTVPGMTGPYDLRGYHGQRHPEAVPLPAGG